MKIPTALLADDANLSQEGKLNVLGVFERIAAASFPVVHPKMVFVFRVHADSSDAGRAFAVRVRLLDDEGGELFDAGGEIVAPRVPPGEFAIANQIFTLVGVRFPRPGIYRFVIETAGLPRHETPLALVQLHLPAEAASGAN